MSEFSKLNGYDVKDKKAIRYYDTVALMKSDSTLKEGMFVKTKGYYSIGDGGESEYIIVNDDTLVEDGGSIHTLSNGLRARLLENDIVSPEQFGAYGDGIHDDYQAIQNAINFIDGGVVELQSKTYIVGDSVVLHRGLKLCGNSSYGEENATLKLKDNVNKPVIVTPNADGGDSTHYMILENLRVNGNGLNQTNETIAVKFYGAYVGSIIRNVFIYNFFGTAIGIQNADVEIDNLWIQNGYTLSNSYAMKINPTLSSSTIASMININNLYIENYRNKVSGNPRETQADRADGLLIYRASNINMNEVHCEGLKVPVTIDGPSIVRMNMLRSIWCGLSTDENSTFVKIDDDLRGLYISNLFRTGECNFSYWILRGSNVTSNSIINVSFDSSTNKTCLPLYIVEANANSENPIIQYPTFVNNAQIKVVGNPSNTGYYINGTNGTSYIRQDGQRTNIGTNVNQSSDKNYITLVSNGNNGDRIEVLNPILLPTRTTYGYMNAGAIYNYQNNSFGTGPIYQTVTGSKYNYIASVQILNGSPSENAHYYGELALDYTNKKLYVATSIGNGANDWTILN